MSGERERKWARLYSISIDFAASVAGFALIGYWIDRHYETNGWAIVICAMLGLVGGMINFIRRSIREYRSTTTEEPGESPERTDGGGTRPPTS
jgi:F0F1-type ATP synthase assembly protein I